MPQRHWVIAVVAVAAVVLVLVLGWLAIQGLLQSGPFEDVQPPQPTLAPPPDPAG